MVVIDDDISFISHHISIIRSKILSQSSFKVFGVGGNFEVVVVLTSVDLEARLISFIGNSESNSCSIHHL